MKMHLIALGISLLAISGCAQLLRGGIIMAQAMRPISQEQEIAIGNAGAQEILQNPNVRAYQDPQVTSYVTEVGNAIAAITPRKDLPWTFQVLESPDRNAMALPGGKLFITTGAIQAMENEAQLAGVLAHEIAHVTQRHGIDQIKRTLVAQGILVSALGTSPQAAQVAGVIAAELVLRGYGRDAEYDADRYGSRFAARAGYDPRALVRFLQILESGGGFPGWLQPVSTHPPLEDRVRRLEQQITQERLSGNQLAPERFKAMTAPLRPAQSLRH